MNLGDLHQGLTAVIWIILALLSLILALIARFYETMAHQRTYFQLFAVPVVLFGASAVRLIAVEKVTGDSWADVLLFLGGASLVTLSYHMYRLMTSGR